jgi:hypothetical protein
MNAGLRLASLIALPVAMLAPSPGHAQWSPWYGWEHQCTAPLPEPNIQVCASAKVATKVTATGGTLIAVETAMHSAAVWGGPSFLEFRPTIPTGTDLQQLWDCCGWWYYEGILSYDMTGLQGRRFSLELPFAVHETDFVGFYSEAYDLREVLAGPLEIIYEVYFESPGYLLPEPRTSFGLAIGLGLLVAFRVKRRGATRSRDAC